MEEIRYRVIRTNRRTTAIQILTEGVVVRCNHRTPDSYIRQLVESKRNWIFEKLSQLPRRAEPMAQAQLRELAAQAVQVIPQRVAVFAEKMGISYGRITIRNQRTRWGSCSGKGNLNFNCLLMLAPSEVLDYVVVHELSHRIHMNHSAAFWETVERYFPNYRNCRKWLKLHGRELMAQLP